MAGGVSVYVLEGAKAGVMGNWQNSGAEQARQHHLVLF